MDDAKRISSPDDPERCQGMTQENQCTLKGQELPDGTRAKYCGIHGGPSSVNTFNKVELRNYQLGQLWGNNVKRISDSKDIKSLKDEIGILRMLMEQRLNSIHDTTDLLIQQSAIMELATRIEKLVKSCHVIEASIGQLLDKTVVLQIGDEIVKVLETSCSPEQLQAVVAKLDEIFSRQREITLGKVI